MGEPSPDAPPVVGAPQDRLDSWKEIAAYLNRDVTTVQRWEKREGMPVHRHVHDKMGSVYAFRADLDAWTRTRKLQAEQENGNRASALGAVVEPTPPIPEAPPKHKFGRPLAVAGLVVAFAVLAAAGFGIYSLVHSRHVPPFASFTITQLTNNGKTTAAAISPDGKYLLSLLDDHGKQSLWLRHIPTNSDAQVIAPADAIYDSLVFSPDGNYLFFRKAADVTLKRYDLMRAPVLGGTPELVLRDLDTAATFSPDGKRIAFVRENDPEDGKSLVITANVDGTDEKTLSVRAITSYPPPLSWSPDGKQLASLSPAADDSWSAIQFQNVSSGKEEARLLFHRAQINDVAWMPDGAGLVVTYQNHPKALARAGIGFVPRATAEIRSITNDTDIYQGLTLSADGKTLATVRLRRSETLYLLPNTGFTGVAPHPAAAQSRDSAFFSWTANGDIYFEEGGALLRISPDGSAKTTVLNDPAAAVLRVGVCAGGQTILVEWAGRTGANIVNIWRVNADGSNPIQLTHGGLDVRPVCSPDAQWVYYMDLFAFKIMRVPLRGGSPEVVPGTQPFRDFVTSADLAVSPDSTRLALLTGGPGQADPAPKIALIPLGGAADSKVRWVLPNPHIIAGASFTPDGQALVYPILENGVCNLWRQPLDGSLGHQLTNFQTDEIAAFQFSPDGKTLGVLQDHTESDAVLLHDTSSSPR